MESVSKHHLGAARMMNSSTFASLFEQAGLITYYNASEPYTLLSTTNYNHYSLLSFLSFMLLFTYTSLHILRSLYAKTRKPNKKFPLPPGPSFFTIVTNLAEFCNNPQQTLAKLAKLHAPDIMRLKLGSSTTIIVSSPEIAKEVMQTHDAMLSDRTVPIIVSSLDHHNFSLPFLPVSPLWRDLRRICNDQLFSNKMLDASQGLRQKKLQELLSDMHKYSMSGEAVDVGRAAFKACINFLSYTFVSQDFVESVENGEYKDIVSTLLKLTGTTNVVDIFPFLRMLDPQGLQKNTTKYLTKFFHNLDMLIEKRMKLREDGVYVTNNDMLDALLDISQQDSQRMDREKIKHFLLDLLVAGTDTTAYGHMG